MENGELYANKKVSHDSDMSPNTFVILRSQTNQSALCVYDAFERNLCLIPDDEIRLGGSSVGVRAKNKEQKFLAI